jgi:large subunit ribosomal protein L6
MSKIGKMPIILPEGVNLEVSDGSVTVSGPTGVLTKKFTRLFEVKKDGNSASILTKGKSKEAKSVQGTYRSIIANMVKGVTQGWQKSLELVGTGYRAELSGPKLIVTIGYSHPVEVNPPEGIKFEVEKSKITVLGADKHLVGQVAAKIRDIRPPEPYKGKGIMYKDEVVRRKPGKAAKAQGAAA